MMLFLLCIAQRKGRYPERKKSVHPRLHNPGQRCGPGSGERYPADCGLSGVKVYGQSAKGMENAVKLSGYATSAINYGYNAYENHQEIKNFHNALQADAWDTLPITTGAMIGLMDSTQTFPTNPMTKVTLATLASILVTITVDKSKEDLKVEDKIKDENDLHEGN